MSKLMKIEEIHQRLVSKFGDSIRELKADVLDPWIEVAAPAIAEVGEYLRSDPELKFESLNDLTGADWLETDPKKKNPCEPHVEVVYSPLQLFSETSLQVKGQAGRDGRMASPGDLPEVPSVASRLADRRLARAPKPMILSASSSRITPNPRRILCPEDWEGHGGCAKITSSPWNTTASAASNRCCGTNALVRASPSRHISSPFGPQSSTESKHHEPDT